MIMWLGRDMTLETWEDQDLCLMTLLGPEIVAMCSDIVK